MDNVIKCVVQKDVLLTQSFLASIQKTSIARTFESHCKLFEYSCDGIVWLISWFAFIWIANSSSLHQMQINLLLGLILDICIVAIVKALVRRRRPEKSKNMLVIGPDKFSFPSGHASRAFFIWSFFIFLLDVNKVFWMPLTAWCLSVCLSRLLLRRHYILDVTAGALLGIFEAILISCMWVNSELAGSIIKYVSDDNLLVSSEG